MISKQHNLIWPGPASGGVLLAGGIGPAVYAGWATSARRMHGTPCGGTCSSLGDTAAGASTDRERSLFVKL